MANRTYDDIVRTTVPLPDSSHRPTRTEELGAEERAAGPRIHHAGLARDDGDAPTIQSIRGALALLDGADLADLDVTIEGGRVQVDGSVASAEDRDRIQRALEDVPGVIAVIDTIRIRDV